MHQPFSVWVGTLRDLYSTGTLPLDHIAPAVELLGDFPQGIVEAIYGRRIVDGFGHAAVEGQFFGPWIGCYEGRLAGTW